MSGVNQDQCPEQCDVKYKKTQEVVGVPRQMIDMITKLVNETDDIIQGLTNTKFKDDLTKYKNISALARTLSTVLTKMPWVNRQVGKMLMKLIRMGRNDHGGDDGRPYPPRPRPPRPGPRPNRPRPNPLRYRLRDEGTQRIEII